MDVEHRLRQRVGVLSGDGADERITVKQSSSKVGANGNIGFGTLLVEERNPSLVGLQSPTLAKPERPWVAEPNASETRETLGICQQPTMIDSIVEPKW
jgi:hypothetical protein